MLHLYIECSHCSYLTHYFFVCLLFFLALGVTGHPSCSLTPSSPSSDRWVSEKGMKKLKEDGISPLDVTKTHGKLMGDPPLGWDVWDSPPVMGLLIKPYLFIWKRYRMGPPSYKLVYNPI